MLDIVVRSDLAGFVAARAGIREQVLVVFWQSGSRVRRRATGTRKRRHRRRRRSGKIKTGWRVRGTVCITSLERVHGARTT